MKDNSGDKSMEKAVSKGKIEYAPVAKTKVTIDNHKSTGYSGKSK